MERVRSFVAIELPPEVKSALVALEASLRQDKYTFVKWVDPESIHLTLKFLGSVTTDIVPRIARVIEKAVSDFPPFNLQIEGLGVFPNWRKPQVVWVGVGGETNDLMRLQKRVEESLELLGFPREDRPYQAHLTLGRLREGSAPAERLDFSNFVRASKVEIRSSFEVRSVSLMKSQLTPTGAVYTRLAEATLSGKRETS